MSELVQCHNGNIVAKLSQTVQGARPWMRKGDTGCKGNLSRLLMQEVLEYLPHTLTRLLLRLDVGGWQFE